MLGCSNEQSKWWELQEQVTFQLRAGNAMVKSPLLAVVVSGPSSLSEELDVPVVIGAYACTFTSRSRAKKVGTR